MSLRKEGFVLERERERERDRIPRAGFLQSLRRNVKPELDFVCDRFVTCVLW